MCAYNCSAKMPKRTVKQCHGSSSSSSSTSSSKDIVITTDQTNETNVTGNSVSATADGSARCTNAVKSSNVGELPARTASAGGGRCCDAPQCNNSRKCVVRQKSQKIVLAPSSGEDHVYHIYGRCVAGGACVWSGSFLPYRRCVRKWKMTMIWL